LPVRKWEKVQVLSRPDRAVVDISLIIDQLYVSARLRAEHSEEVRARDVDLILNMVPFPPPKVYTQPPFRTVNLPTIDSLLTPIPIRFLRRGVETALPVIQRGRCVLTYCRAGRHRSVAMASCILIGLGYPAVEAMRLVDERRSVADPYAWHIRRRILKFEQQWHKPGV
jgi:hypothetical protein